MGGLTASLLYTAVTVAGVGLAVVLSAPLLSRLAPPPYERVAVRAGVLLGSLLAAIAAAHLLVGAYLGFLAALAVLSIAPLLAGILVVAAAARWMMEADVASPPRDRGVSRIGSAACTASGVAGVAAGLLTMALGVILAHDPLEALIVAGVAGAPVLLGYTALRHQELFHVVLARAAGDASCRASPLAAAAEAMLVLAAFASRNPLLLAAAPAPLILLTLYIGESARRAEEGREKPREHAEGLAESVSPPRG